MVAMVVMTVVMTAVMTMAVATGSMANVGRVGREAPLVEMAA